MDYRQFAAVLRHLEYDFWTTSFDYIQVDGLRDLRVNKNNVDPIRKELTDLCQMLRVKHTWSPVYLPNDKVAIGLWVNLD